MHLKRALSVVVAVLATLATAVILPAPAQAATSDIGYRDASYRDTNNVQVPTDDKPQSKLWFQDGTWWGVLYSTEAHATTIQRLSLATQQWSDTGLVVDDRPTAKADVLWDNGKLYVVSGTTVISEYSSPPNPADVEAGSAKLFRFSYDVGTQTYSLNPGFPAVVHQGSTESITIAKDSTGKLWVTYTVVASDNSSTVYVNSTQGSDTTWGTPFALPTTTASVHYDDISAVIAFQGDKIGIMWSNQLTKKFYFAVHHDGQPDSSWQTETAYGSGIGGCSSGCANDHVNLKQLSSDGSGRLFAAVKTANRNTGQPFVVLLVRDGNSAWSAKQFGSVEDLHTRPMIMVDEEHRQLIMFGVSPEVGGTIYYKKAPLDNIAFSPGVGTPFLQSSTDTDISNPTTTKQNINGTTGLVVLASANTHGRYWHNYLDLSADPSPPPAAPTQLSVTSPTINTDSTLKLNWSDNSANETGFSVERSSGTGSYAEVTTLPSGSTAFTDTSLSPGSTYTYRVRAYNAVGYSLYSNLASGTTAQTGPTRTFTAVADTYVDSGAPTTNFGKKTILSVDASPVQESYVKFTLSGLTGSTVTNAKLRLYVSDNGSSKGGSVAKTSNTSWSETTVNYNTRPALDATTLATLGAVNIGSWYDFDVTPAVTGDGTVGLGVRTSSTDGVHYASREDSAHAPQLVVTVAPGDSTPPNTVIDSGPSGTVTSAAAAFGFSSSELGSTFECSLDGAAFSACTAPQNYAGLAEGQHTFSVRAIDAVGNIDPTPASRTWTVDTVAPSTVIDASPPVNSNSTSASFSFSADEPGVTFTCKLDGGSYTACTSPKSLTGLSEGEHTFTVQGNDPAGNTETQPPSFTWTVDTAAPNTTVDTGPQTASTSDSATFTFSSDESAATFECSLDGAPFSACSSPTTYTGLVDGNHSFQVRAVDAAGNMDATPAQRDWTITTVVSDTTPPAVMLTEPADGDTVRGTVTISAVATDDVSVDHVDILVDGTVVATDGTAPYTTTWSSTRTADGSVRLTARALDTSGNSATSDGRTVTVDNTAPDTTLDSGPSGSVSTQSATFGFTSNDTTAVFECSLDAAAYSNCSSPVSYTNLTGGAHTFQVRAKDSVGNVDASPASRTWTVDTVAPDTTITSGPSGNVVSRSATLAFSSNETATFECSLDNGGWNACSSPKQYNGLADGAHTVSVRAQDAAGNVDATPASRSWTVDPVAFSEDFETGDFSKWSSVHTAIDGTAKVQTGTVKSGTYAASLSAPSNTSYSYLSKTLSASQSDLTFSSDINITTEGASGQEVPIVKLYDASKVRILYVYRRNVSGRIYVVYGGTTYASTSKLALNSWAHFNIHTVVAGSGASTVQVNMDGVSIYSTTTASIGTAGIRTLQVGNDKQLPFALFVDNIEARI
jgi:hypothetical protein